jgi:tetratricopeptide (TPR) repeat protein
VRQYPAARTQLDKALKEKPDDIAALLLYARLEALAGVHAAAQQRASAALKAAPNNALALLTQGVVLETAGDESAARNWYEKAVAANADLAEPHQLLADGAMRQGQFAKAAEQYRALIRLDPTRGERYARLAAALSADGHCVEALKQLATDLNEHPRMPLLVQTQVRVASTCRGATAADRSEALQRGNNLYRQQPTPSNTEALALAAAANGKWDDATQLQGAAIFELVKVGDQAEIALYKSTFQSFQSKQMPDKPWAAAHPLYHPGRLQPVPAETK